jgi:alpha-galactosidase
MKNIASSLFVASAVQSVALAAPAIQDESLTKRLENGLGRTPALGYNNWVNNIRWKRVRIAQVADSGG